MAWPRKGILIRLCIYVPLVTFFAWRAWTRYRSEQAEAAADDDLERKLAPHKKTVTLPDGSTQEIVELSREEAEQILGPIPQLDDGKAAVASPEAATKPAPASEPVKEPAPTQAPPPAKSDPAPAEPGGRSGGSSGGGSHDGLPREPGGARSRGGGGSSSAVPREPGAGSRGG